MPLAVQRQRHAVIAQDRAVRGSRGGHSRRGCAVGGGQQRHRAERGQRNPRLARTDRHSLALGGFRTVGKSGGQVDDFLPREALAVKDGHGVLIGRQQSAAGGGVQRSGVLLQRSVGGVCLGVHAGDGRTGQDIVELVQQQNFPQALGLDGVVGMAALGSQCAPQLHVVQGVLAAAVVFLHGGLGRVSAAVGVEVQFAVPCVLRPALGLQIVKEIQRRHHLDPGHTLQIFFAQGVLDVIATGAAAAITVAKGNQEIFQMPLLHAVFPDVA